MVYVNDSMCSGCGDCVDVCPSGAMTFRDNRAFIDQDLCNECGACINACPQGAIISEEKLPVNREIIQVPAIPLDHPAVQISPIERASVREIILPAIGSMLVWTGRELAPRLADLAIGYLDRRIQSFRVTPTQGPVERYDNQVPMSMGKGRHRRHRLRRRKSNL